MSGPYKAPDCSHKIELDDFNHGDYRIPGSLSSGMLQRSDKKKEMMEEYGGRKATAMTAQESTQKAANVSRFVFRMPDVQKVIGPIVLVSFLWGFLFELAWGDVAFNSIMESSLGLFLLPALASVLASFLLDKLMRGRLYVRRAAFLSLISLLSMAPVMLIMFILDISLDIDLYIILVFAYASIIWVRHLFLISISNSKHQRVFLISITQSTLGFMAVHYLYPSEVANMDWYVSLIFSLIFLSTIVWFLEIVSSPVKTDFNTNLWENVGNAIAHLTERGDKGVSGLESFFASFSEEIDVYMAVVGFRSLKRRSLRKKKAKGEIKEGGNKGKNGAPHLKERLKGLFIIPYVHPGPFGIIGGSDLRRKLMRYIGKLSHHTVLFHGTATHDINLASTEETGKIADSVRKLTRGIKYKKTASPFVRYHKDFHMCTQFFGDGAVNVYSSAPNPTDDIDYATGNMAVQEARLQGAERAVLVDSHNCLEPGVGGIHFGTRRSYEILEYISESIVKARCGMSKGVRVGIAQDADFTVDQGISDGGIQVIVVETGGQKAAYVVFDGNNMIPGLRENIIKSVRKKVDECEVFTSDNHSVNVNLGGYNPVGYLYSPEDLVKRTLRVFDAALKDLESVEVGMNTGFARSVKVFGVENTARLTSMINSSTSILLKSALATITVAVLSCGLVITLLP